MLYLHVFNFYIISYFIPLPIYYSWLPPYWLLIVSSSISKHYSYLLLHPSSLHPTSLHPHCLLPAHTRSILQKFKRLLLPFTQFFLTSSAHSLKFFPYMFTQSTDSSHPLQSRINSSLFLLSVISLIPFSSLFLSHSS